MAPPYKNRFDLDFPDALTSHTLSKNQKKKQRKQQSKQQELEYMRAARIDACEGPQSDMTAPADTKTAEVPPLKPWTTFLFETQQNTNQETQQEKAEKKRQQELEQMRMKRMEALNRQQTEMVATANRPEVPLPKPATALPTFTPVRSKKERQQLKREQQSQQDKFREQQEQLRYQQEKQLQEQQTAKKEAKRNAKAREMAAQAAAARFAKAQEERKETLTQVETPKEDMEVIQAQKIIEIDSPVGIQKTCAVEQLTEDEDEERVEDTSSVENQTPSQEEDSLCTQSAYEMLHKQRSAFLNDEPRYPFPAINNDVFDRSMSPEPKTTKYRGPYAQELRIQRSTFKCPKSDRNCRPSKLLRSCRHQVEELLKTSGEYGIQMLKNELDFWNPVQFPQGEKLAKEMSDMVLKSLREEEMKEVEAKAKQNAYKILQLRRQTYINNPTAPFPVIPTWKGHQCSSSETPSDCSSSRAMLGCCHHMLEDVLRASGKYGLEFLKEELELWTPNGLPEKGMTSLQMAEKTFMMVLGLVVAEQAKQTGRSVEL